MNDNINLCEILKGHEGETFYSPIFGNVKIKSINYPIITIISSITDIFYINSNGKFYNNSDAICIFPSKDQRDWNKWDEEHNLKTPKTWSELSKGKHDWTIYVYEENAKTPIEKSALALLKIHQLIEIGYGGNVSKDEFFDEHVMKYIINLDKEDEFYIYKGINIMNTHIAFHTEKQATEFLKYPENMQLLKDYFMIND